MLGTLMDWINGGAPGGAEGGRRAPVAGDDTDRRQTERFHFTGAEVFLFLPSDQSYRMRLRDVSCEGLSGITDAPVSPGELVMVQFEETFMPAAHVSWTRNAWVGLSVVNPLPTARLHRLCQRHQAGAAWSPAMRAASDLNSWWTDLADVQQGRRPRLVRR